MMQLRSDSLCSYLGAICLTRDRLEPAQARVYKTPWRSGLPSAGSEQTRWQTIARRGAIRTVIKQKSADGIVAKCPS